MSKIENLGLAGYLLEYYGGNSDYGKGDCDLSILAWIVPSLVEDFRIYW